MSLEFEHLLSTHWSDGLNRDGVTFSSASSMNLSLKDEVSVLNIEILGNFEGLIGSDGSISTLNKDVVLSHESFALIFMKIKISLDVVGKTST